MNRLNTNLIAAWLLCVIAILAMRVTMADPVESPLKLLQKTSDEVINVLKAKADELEKNPDQIYGVVNQYIIPHLDDVTMAKLALGKNWNKASREQKIEFVEQFRTLLVRTYGKSLLEYRNQTINFFPLRLDEGEDRVEVKSEVQQPGAPSIPVNYRMRLKDNEWKVYDLSIDGVSLVTSYRGTFAQEVRKGGIEGLLQLLRDKNTKAST
jgi:phospholipid transport system substrate-binding protein